MGNNFYWMEWKTADVGHDRSQPIGHPANSMQQKPRRSFDRLRTVTPFATPWLPLDVATLAPLPSLKLRHGHSACTSLPSDSPRLHEARASFEPPDQTTRGPGLRGREQARRNVSEAIACGSDDSNATEEGAVLTLVGAGGQSVTSGNFL